MRMKSFYFLLLFISSSFATVENLSRPRRDTPSGGFGISYNLGHGGYASFSLPPGHTSNSHPPPAVAPHPGPSHQAVPIFLNNPLYQAPVPAPVPVPVPVPASYPTASPVVPSSLYQTHFIPPPVAPLPHPAFTPSKPDKIPPHLHPALNPTPPPAVHHPHPPHQPALNPSHHPPHHPPHQPPHLQPALNPTQLKPFPPFRPALHSPTPAAVHHPHPHHPPHHPHHPHLPHPPQPAQYSPPLPYTPPVIQYDPFEFQKTENESDSSTADSPSNFPKLNPPPPPVAAPFPPVNNPPPPSATPFPPVSLQPLPSPLPPPIPIPAPEDFPEYDAVPPGLGPLIPSFIPVRQTLLPTSSHPLLLAPRAKKEDPSQFLFTANRGFGLPTSERLKRKHEKTSRMINSHGGPVLHRGREDCGPTHHREELQLVVETFPACSYLMGDCGLDRNNSKLIRNYGVCLNTKYPATVTLNLGRTLSSGHGSVSFSTDSECTQFVHQFFPHCGPHLSSCHQVEQDAEAAGLILGCLFSQYPSLMIPLLGNEEELSTNII